MNRDALGDRMKGYEAASDYTLPARLPVIVRLDGNSFSRFTEQLALEKPFDPRFDVAMNAAATAVISYAHGCLAYVQSDEITLLLRNDRTHEDAPFLGNRVQKIASLLASAATDGFNRALRQSLAYDAPAIFDARVFVVPPAEVNNVFLWRQKDAFKNCVGAYAWFGLKAKHGDARAQRMLHGTTTKARQELLFQELGINIATVPTAHRRGRAVVRLTREVPLAELVPPKQFDALVAAGRAERTATTLRHRYEVDADIPDFHREPRYVERFLD